MNMHTDPGGVEPLTPTATRSSAPKTNRFAKAITSLFAAFALFGSGLGIGWLVTSEPPADPTPAAIEIAAPSTTAPPAGAEPARDLTEGAEPVADIAEAVLPSVVQIEVGQSGVGSGVIYDSEGLILTAAHVVEGAPSVNIRLSDGSRLVGTVLGSDTSNDVAVIQVDRTDLPAIELALDDEIRVGQLAVAIGSPWGLESTVTSGVVSSVNRSIPGTEGFQNMIQTDASINPGNSGGALVDRYGRLIGINVSIYSTSGANDGVGFAVPVDRAYRVAQALEGGSGFVAGFLGVRGENAGVGETPGAVITEITPGTAAAESGLEPGDTVISVDDRAVTGIADLAGEIRSYQAGEVVTIRVIRDGQTFDIPVTLGSN